MRFTGKHADYYFSDSGSTGIPLVLLHGFTGTSSTWDRFRITGERKCRLIAIDMPGHGKTIGNMPVTMEQFSDDLQALLGSIGIKQYHLLGYSMGGRAALFHACKYSASILSLVLESASPGLETETERTIRKERDEQIASKILSEGVESFVDQWESLPLFDSQKRLPDDVRTGIRTERLGQRAEGLAASLRGMGTGAQLSLWTELPSLKMPVLLIAGSLDLKFIKIAEQMNERLQNGEIRIVSDAGHAIHVEKPKKFDKVVIEFVTACT